MAEAPYPRSSTSRNQYLNELFAEIDTDPNAYGYAPLVAAEQHQAIASILNEVRPEITITDRILTRNEMLESVVATEYDVLTDRKVQLWTNLLIAEAIDTTAGEHANQLRHIWTNTEGPQTRSNLFTRLDRPGSRAEQLWDPLWNVPNTDVTEAIKGGGALVE